MFSFQSSWIFEIELLEMFLNCCSEEPVPQNCAVKVKSLNNSSETRLALGFGRSIVMILVGVTEVASS